MKKFWREAIVFLVEMSVALLVFFFACNCLNKFLTMIFGAMGVL